MRKTQNKKGREPTQAPRKEQGKERRGGRRENREQKGTDSQSKGDGGDHRTADKK